MTALTILNKEIRQLDGLYSLNDLHKASGGNRKHQPSNFTRRDETVALIMEIDQSSNMRTAIKSKACQVNNGGKNAGTWVSKELVYAYAMWISPAFALTVIRTFDNLVTGNYQPTTSPLSTPATRKGLVSAVRQIVGRFNLDIQRAWRLVHERYHVLHVSEMTQAEVDEAVEYLHRLMLHSTSSNYRQAQADISEPVSPTLEQVNDNQYLNGYEKGFERGLEKGSELANQLQPPPSIPSMYAEPAELMANVLTNGTFVGHTLANGQVHFRSMNDNEFVSNSNHLPSLIENLDLTPIQLVNINTAVSKRLAMMKPMQPLAPVPVVNECEEVRYVS